MLPTPTFTLFQELCPSVVSPLNAKAYLDKHQIKVLRRV